MARSFVTLLAPITALLLASAAHAAPFAAKELRTEFAGPTAPLSLTLPNGNSMNIIVDGAGNYQAPGVMLQIAGGNVIYMAYAGETLVDGASIVADNITPVDASTARSRFSASGLDVALTQTLAPGSLPGSFELTLRYRITNPGSETRSVVVGRYQDSDMRDPNQTSWVGDTGYLPTPGRWAYLLNTPTPSLAQPTTYVGLAGSPSRALSDSRAAISQCCRDYEVLPEENRTIYLDLDGDGLGEGIIGGTRYDRTMMGTSRLTLAAGASATLKIQILFGHGPLSGLGDLPR